MSSEAIAFRHRAMRVLSDPHVKLATMYDGYRMSQNPYFAWRSIEICAESNVECPEWVTEYIVECARRMMAAGKQRSADVRKVLPGVLGFRSRRGPGNPLNPNANSDQIRLALKFAYLIHKGLKPSAAARDACAILKAPRADAIDEKTVRRWLCDYFEVARFARTNAEWKAITGDHCRSVVTLWEELFREIAP